MTIKAIRNRVRSIALKAGTVYRFDEELTALVVKCAKVGEAKVKRLDDANIELKFDDRYGMILSIDDKRGALVIDDITDFDPPGIMNSLQKEVRKLENLIAPDSRMALKGALGLVMAQEQQATALKNQMQEALAEVENYRKVTARGRSVVCYLTSWIEKEQTVNQKTMTPPSWVRK